MWWALAVIAVLVIVFVVWIALSIDVVGGALNQEIGDDELS